MPLETTLSPIMARVLGSLIEKELTTPEQYPLSINSLTLACNQKSNREPVMELTENEVMRALEELRSKQLAWQRSVAGARVLKYEHNMGGKWRLGPDEIAALCVLLLRGPQTVGEIKGRSGRMHEFPSLPDVEATLEKLIVRPEGPFVIKLPRLPGHKEARYAHLLCGEVVVPEEVLSPLTTANIPASAPADRVTALEERVAFLENSLASIESTFAEFRKQFE